MKDVISILPKWICGFNSIPNKILAGFLVGIDKLIPKFMWKVKRPIRQTILKKKDKVGEYTLLEFKTFFKNTIIWQLWYWYKGSQYCQWNRREPGTHIHTYTHTHMIIEFSRKVPEYWNNYIFINRKLILTPTSHYTQKFIQEVS